MVLSPHARYESRVMSCLNLLNVVMILVSKNISLPPNSLPQSLSTYILNQDDRPFLWNISTYDRMQLQCKTTLFFSFHMIFMYGKYLGFLWNILRYIAFLKKEHLDSLNQSNMGAPPPSTSSIKREWAHSLLLPSKWTLQPTKHLKIW